MNYKKIFKRETKVIAYVVVALTIVLLGSSYALFFKVREDNNNQVVQAGSLIITYSQANSSEAKTILPGTDGKIECLKPLSDREFKNGNGSDTCKFVFTVTNEGNLPSQYNIFIYNYTENSESLDFVDQQYIKLSLRKQVNEGEKSGTSEVVGDEIQVLDKLPLKDENTQRRLADTNVINPGQSITFSLQFWLDDNAPSSIIKQAISLGLDVDNVVYEQPTASSVLKSSVNTNGLLKIESVPTTDEENKDYRYTGTNPNNYVYFNCQNEDITSCEKWRILGIYNPYSNNPTIKLINPNTEIIKEWDINSNNVYSSSSIKQYLNTDYYNKLSTISKNMIANVPNYLNGVADLNITAEELLKQEQASTEKENSYVSLMTLSDYALASGITTKLDNTDALKSTWLFADKAEWLINKNTNNEIYAIGEAGNIETSATNALKLIRPVVYLNNDVKIIDGDGTFENPYVLQ